MLWYNKQEQKQTEALFLVRPDMEVKTKTHLSFYVLSLIAVGFLLGLGYTSYAQEIATTTEAFIPEEKTFSERYFEIYEAKVITDKLASKYAQLYDACRLTR